MSVWLSLLHGLELALISLLLGGLFFHSLTLPSAQRESALRAARFRLRSLALLALAVSILFWVGLSAEMAESWELADLWPAMTETQFGHWCCLRILSLVGILAGLSWSMKIRGLALLAIPTTLSLSISGHAGAQNEGKLFTLLLDFFHLIAVSTWFGGLLSLWFSLKETGPEHSYAVVKRFSHFAMASTAVIAFSGFGISLRYGLELRAPWITTYGQLLLIKTGLFAGALLAASINQFLHLRNWSPEKCLQFVRRVRREVVLELAIVSVIFLVVGILTRTALPLEAGMN